MKEPEFFIIYIVAEDLGEARQISNALVKEKLVACVNIIPKISSEFWWEGKIEHADEVGIIAKTKRELIDEVIERVKEIHSYDIPCVIALPIFAGNPDFLKWIKDVTK